MTTTETTTSTLPAAWYRDPSGRHERRWWDGRSWTDKVADGQEISVDAPVRERPVPAAVPPEPEPTTFGTGPASFEDDAAAFGTESEDEVADAEVDPGSPQAGFDGMDRAKVPIAERATTAPTAGRTLDLRAMAIGGVGLAVVVAAILWGFTNRSTAADWRDRGEALQEELTTMSSNADALEQALERSANRGAQLGDRQEQFREVEDAAVATTSQLDACVHDVDLVLRAVALGHDLTVELERANESCVEAQVDNAVLADLLRSITSES